MKKTIIRVAPLWDAERDFYWMLPGYLEGLGRTGDLLITLPLTENVRDISWRVFLCNGFLFTGGQESVQLISKEIASNFDFLSMSKDRYPLM